MVVVELLSENNWATPSNEIAFSSSNAEDGKKKKEQRRMGHYIFIDRDTFLYLEYEEDKFKNTGTTTQPSGCVVGILNRNWRSYVATIQEEKGGEGGSIHLAIPLDPVIPKIRVRYQDVKLIQDKRIVVRIDNW
jgi:DIS3-like exonuclease 1